MCVYSIVKERTNEQEREVISHPFVSSYTRTDEWLPAVVLRCTRRATKPSSISKDWRSSAVSSASVFLLSVLLPTQNKQTIYTFDKILMWPHYGCWEATTYPLLSLSPDRRWTMTLQAYSRLGTTRVSAYALMIVSSSTESSWSVPAHGTASNVAIRSTTLGLALTLRNGATTTATRSRCSNVFGFSMASASVPSRNSSHSSFSRDFESKEPVAVATTVVVSASGVGVVVLTSSAVSLA